MSFTMSENASGPGSQLVPFRDAQNSSRGRAPSRSPEIWSKSPARRERQTSRSPSSIIANPPSPSSSRSSPRMTLRVRVNGPDFSAGASNPASSDSTQMGTRNHCYKPPELDPETHHGASTPSPQQVGGTSFNLSSRLKTTIETSLGLTPTPDYEPSHYPSSNPHPGNPFRNLARRPAQHRCNNPYRNSTSCLGYRPSQNPYRKHAQHSLLDTSHNLSTTPFPNSHSYGNHSSLDSERETLPSETQPENSTLEFLIRREQERKREEQAAMRSPPQSSNPWHRFADPQIPATPQLQPQRNMRDQDLRFILPPPGAKEDRMSAEEKLRCQHMQKPICGDDDLQLVLIPSQVDAERMNAEQKLTCKPMHKPICSDQQSNDLISLDCDQVEADTISAEEKLRCKHIQEPICSDQQSNDLLI